MFLGKIVKKLFKNEKKDKKKPKVKRGKHDVVENDHIEIVKSGKLFSKLNF